MKLGEDTVMAFSIPQTTLLGEKLILKDYLIGRNYELERINKELKEKCDSQEKIINLYQEEVIKVEYKERIATELQGSYKEYYERYKKMLEAEERRKRIWRTLAIVTTTMAVTSTGIIISK